MTDISFPYTGSIDGSGTVTADAPCRKCGYNLRGLSVTGRCPECGAAVGLSIHGDYLRYSDPKWVYTLRRGVTLIIAALALVVGAVILMIPFGMILQNANVGVVIMAAAVLVAYILVLAGTWLLTTPDPSGVGEDQYGTARKIIRIALAVGVGNAALDVISSAFTFPPGVNLIIQVVAFGAAIFGLVGLFAQLQYLEKLALRIPDTKIAGRAAFLKYAFTITYGIVLASSFGTQLMMARSGAGPVFAVVGCFTGIASLLLLVFGIMYLLMLEKIGKRFAEQARIAEQSWAAIETAPPATPAV